MSKKLDELNAKLDRIIELLEQLTPETVTVDIDWPVPDIPIFPDFPTPIRIHENKKCAKCGINLEGVMSYVCTVQDCPTGLGGVRC